MSTTIFCTFEQQDLADLAIGKLRNTVIGIRSIHYIGSYNSAQTILNKSLTASTSFGISGVQAVNFQPAPSRPLTIRITCADAAASAVKSKLINMRAYKIITTR